MVLNHHITATNHFTGFSLAVSFSEGYPFPLFLVVIDLNQVDLVLSTKGLHQLDIHRLITVGCKHTRDGLGCKHTRDGLGACLRLWQLREFHVLGHHG